MLDNGEYEGIYTVRAKCIIGDCKKSSITSMIGGFKPNNIKPKWYSIIITQSFKEVLLNCAKHDDSFIYSFSNTSDDKLCTSTTQDN